MTGCCVSLIPTWRRMMPSSSQTGALVCHQTRVSFLLLTFLGDMGVWRRLLTVMTIMSITDVCFATSGPCVATYWRPGFDNMLYPYKPAHIERPKEVRKLYVIQMPEKSYLSVPSNYKLIAVPLFELHDHIQRYGPVIAQVPTMLSRLDFVMAEGMKDDEDMGTDGVKVEEKGMVLS